MRVHVIGIFHVQPNKTQTHCAFTQKTITLTKMLRLSGHEVFFYGNPGSEVPATETVTLMSAPEFDGVFPKHLPTETVGKNAIIGSPGWTLFNARLEAALRERVCNYDFICHPFGGAHAGMVTALPQAFHVESGIGYPDAPIGAWRIFESETWRSYHWGRWENDPKYAGNKGLNRFYSWVIPNAYDPVEWPLNGGDIPTPIQGQYVLYMARLAQAKGLLTVGQVANEWYRLYPRSELTFVVVGQGRNTADYTTFDNMLSDAARPHVQYLPPISGLLRACLTGHALATLQPTNFVEPFGGSVVEAMLTGTPAITSDWGAFVETVNHGVSGYRCKVLADWIAAINQVNGLHRSAVRQWAMDRYTIDVCAPKYDRALRQIAAINGDGWTGTHSYLAETF